MPEEIEVSGVNSESHIDEKGNKHLNYKEKMIELLKDGGCFVNTRVGLYRGNKKLTAEELGIDGELPPKLVSFGNVKLLPDDICEEMKLIRSIENKVNGLVNIHTFEFEGFGRYIKNSEIEIFSSQIEELRSEFEGVVGVFEINYPDYIERSVEYWGDYADTFGIECSLWKKAIRDSFIPVERLREKFKYVVTYLQMPSPAKDAWVNCESEAQALSEEFLETTMRQLRHETFVALDDMASAIASGKWNQKTLNRLPKIIERIENMQLIPDDDLMDKITSFKDNFVTMEAKDYKTEDGEEKLLDLQKGLRKTVKDLREMADADMKSSMEQKLKKGGKRKLVF